MSFRFNGFAFRRWVGSLLTGGSILYFDNDFVPGSFWNQYEYVKYFIWQRQFYQKPKSHRRPSPSHDDACRCLEISSEDFTEMDRRKLTRAYRLLAKKTHPDSGGESKRFVEITAAYETLLKMK